MPRDSARHHVTRGKTYKTQTRETGDICWGRMPVIALLESSPQKVVRLYISRTMQRQMYLRLTELAKANGIAYVMMEPRHLDEMTGGENHQGVAAVISSAVTVSFDEAMASVPPVPQPALIVIFDHLEDPHNVGAIIRTAEAVGASFAVIPNRRGALPTGTVAKTSAGASMRIPVVMTGSVTDAIKRAEAAGFWCFGLHMDGSRSLMEADMSGRAAIVIGSEGRGLSSTAAAACDDTLRIPIVGGTGSLNASSAAAIALYEWFRSNTVTR